MSDDPAEAPAPDAEPVLFHGSYTIGEGYARRAANAFMVFQLRRPLLWIQIALPLVVLPLLVISLDHDSRSPIVAATADAVLVVFYLVSWLSRRGALTNQIAYTSAPGSIREVSMTESTFSTRTSNSSGQSAYRHYESAEAWSGFVFLRVRGASIRVILPREVFTDDALAFLRSKIAG